jgi:hypothetical protein
VIVGQIKKCEVGERREEVYWDITRNVIVAQIKSLDLCALEDVNWKATLYRIVGQIDR